MKLSEAIRIGAKLKPQSYSPGVYSGTSCALEAARDGVSESVTHKSLYRDTIKKHWPWALATNDTTLFLCPNRKTLYPMETIIIWLNDNKRWTREDIADWVATVEPSDNISC